MSISNISNYKEMNIYTHVYACVWLPRDPSASPILHTPRPPLPGAFYLPGVSRDLSVSALASFGKCYLL